MADDMRVEIERMNSKLDIMNEKLHTAIERMTDAVQELKGEVRHTVRWLVFAVIGASLSAEALRIVAAAILKGMP